MSLSVLDTVAKKLHADSKTYEEAKTLYPQAYQLTRRGSRHHFLYSLNALAAICVLIASNRIGKGDVTSAQAQVSCAMDPKTFQNAQSMVEHVLSSTDALAIQKSVSFKALLSRYGVDEAYMVPMMEVRDHLQRATAISSEMHYVIFYWVCSEIFKMDVPTREMIQKDFRISPRNWQPAWNILELQCNDLKKQQIKHAETNASHNRRRLTKSPSKTALMKRTLSSVEVLLPSPSKRRKALPSSPFSVEEGLTAEASTQRQAKTPASQSNFVTPAKRTISGDDDSGDEVSKEVILVTPSRKRKCPDFSAWEASRPVAKSSEQQSPSKKSQDERLFKTPNKNAEMDVFIETPMTSTGMESETSSPRSPFTPVTRKKPPQGLKTTELPSIIPFEERSRRQRRRLRAPFLDPGVYTWKPDVLTADKTRRAQKWESTLVTHYGDPWDDL